MTKRIAIMMLLMTMIITGCLKSQKEMIIGKWKTQDDRGTGVEFYEDNTFSLSGKTEPCGRWIITKGGKLKLSLPLQGKSTSKFITFKLVDDVFIISPDKGKDIKHIRIK